MSAFSRLNADEKKATTQTVIAEGVGASADEALKDAFRNAVRQVVGAVVDAETLVKNDEVISDKVLTYCGGFVKKYEELSKKVDKGLVRIKIKAQIENKSIVEKLKAANVKVKDVDGKGLFAEAVTELDREKDAAALLKKTLEGFPQNCMTISVVGEPKLIEKNDKNATVTVVVQVEPDAEAYKAFVKRLQPILEKLVTDKSGKGEFLVTSKLGKDGDKYFSIDDDWDYGLPKWMPKAYKDRKLIEGQVVLALCNQSSKSTDRMDFSYVILDKTLQPLLVKTAYRLSKAKLTLVDQSGDVVVTDRFNMAEKESSSDYRFVAHLFTAVRFERGSSAQTIDVEYSSGHFDSYAKVFFIAPTFISVNNFYSFRHNPKMLIERKLTLSLDELRKVQKVKVELQAAEK